jgi:hypothetical protein
VRSRRIGLAALIWLMIVTASQATPLQLQIQGSRQTTIISSAGAAWEKAISLPLPLPTLPYQHDLEESAAPSHSYNSVEYSAIAEQFCFSVDVRHTVDGPPGARFRPAARTLGHIRVTPLNDTPYHVSGFYRVTDNSENGSAYSSLTAYVEGPGGTWVDEWNLFNRQTSISTHDSSLVIGEAGGDLLVDRANFGKTSGILLAGHKYSFGFEMSLNTVQPDENGQFSGASAIGEFTVTLGGPVVPEPSCSTLCGVLSIVCISSRFIPITRRVVRPGNGRSSIGRTESGRGRPAERTTLRKRRADDLCAARPTTTESRRSK